MRLKVFPAHASVHSAVGIYSVCAPAVGQLLPSAANGRVIHSGAVSANGYGFSVSTVNVFSNQMAWDLNSNVIYLSIPAFAGAPGPAGNAIQALDPLTGQFGSNVQLATQPYSLSISATGKYVYAATFGSVQRYSLPGLAPNLVIPLGHDEDGYPLYSGWVEASPVDDSTAAVVTDYSMTTPAFSGVFVYDDGVPRAGSICQSDNACSLSSDDFFSVRWNGDASWIFGADNLWFSTAPVTPAGIGKVTDYGGVNGLGNGFGDKIHFDRTTGKIFADGGTVFDPSTAAIVLSLSNVQLVVPDGALGKVFALHRDPDSGAFIIISFDINTGAPLDTASVGASGIPVDLIRWGTNGLAVSSMVDGGAGSAVYLIIGSFVNSPVGPSVQPFITPYGIVAADSTLNTFQSGEWISIFGGNPAGTTALWHGDFPTLLGGTSVTIDGVPAYLSYVSPNQLNLQVPDIADAGFVPVIVSTANGTAESYSGAIGLAGPSILLIDSKHAAAIIYRFDGSGAYGRGTYDILGPTGTSLGYQTVAAKPGDQAALFAVGLGPTNLHVPAGQPFSGSAPLTYPPDLLINGYTVTPSFAGLSGAGLYQVNFTVPAGLGSGDVPLVIETVEQATKPGPVISLK
jgi:uncharacterized protein (TIGR03437 family)